MTRMKKNAINAIVTIALLSSVAFAEGDMGGGGFAAYDEPVKIGDTRQAEGDMGGGGRVPMTEEPSYVDEMIRSITDYLGSIL